MASPLAWFLSSNRTRASNPFDTTCELTHSARTQNALGFKLTTSKVWGDRGHKGALPDQRLRLEVLTEPQIR
jgi:hypothetical protein